MTSLMLSRPMKVSEVQLQNTMWTVCLAKEPDAEGCYCVPVLELISQHLHLTMANAEMCFSITAVNVTAQLIAWNATQAPVVSHNSVYTIAPLGSKQFLSFDLKDTLTEAGVSTSDMSKYFMHLTVRPLA